MECKVCFRAYRGVAAGLDGCCSKSCYNKLPRECKPVRPTLDEMAQKRFQFIQEKLKARAAADQRKAEGRRKKRAGRQRKKDSFYISMPWRELRYDLLAQYGRKCMLCSSEKGQMHVDHIVPKSIRPDLALDRNNLQILCEDCNIGKGNRDMKDFRPEVVT